MAQDHRGSSAGKGSGNRGSSGRSDSGRGGAPRGGGSSRQGGGYGRSPQRDDQRSYGDRGPKRSYGDRPQGDRPQRSYDDRGPKRSYGDRPQGDRPQRSYDDRGPRSYDRGDRPQRSYDDRGPRSYDRGDRPQGDRPPRSYDDRGPKRSYGDRPQGDRPPRSYDDRGPKRSYGDRPQGDRPQRSYDDRAPRSYDRGDRPQGDRPQRSYDDRGPRSYDRGDRPQRSFDDRGPRQGGGYGRRDDRSDRPRQGGGYGRRDDRDSRGDRGPRRDERRPRVEGPAIPDSVTGNELDKAIRGDLRTLSLEAAEVVSRHLVMVQRLLDDRPDQAWEHAKAAVARGGRLAVVREAAGVAAYTAGEYADALAQFRAARRISGSDEFWPVMADCERGLGRPERAIAMAGAPEVERLDKGGRVEMRIVASGARRDLGQLDAAVVTLQCPELKSQSTEPWSARIKFAYADALMAAGREAEARAWFARADEVDEHEQTEAAERLAELDGLVWVDALADDEDAEGSDELDDLDLIEEMELGEESDEDDLDEIEVLETEVEALEERVEALEELVEDLVEDDVDAGGAGAEVDVDVDPEDEVAELLGEPDER